MSSCSERSSFDSQSSQSFYVYDQVKPRCETLFRSSTISRRRIISSSLDEFYSADSVSASDLSDQKYDIWYHEDKLYTDNIKEVMDKCFHIDDEIWGKIVIMERNQRIAKAYIRGPVLSINGSWDTFDGQIFGLRSLTNSIRDMESHKIISNLAEGIKIMKDQKGNIFLKRLCNCNIFIQGWHKAYLDPNSSSISDELIESKGRVGVNRLCKLFDIEKFKQNILQELKSSKPDKDKLESQCISILAIGQDSASLLSTPCWIIVINIIAFKFLRTKLKKKVIKSFAGSIWTTLRRLSSSRTSICSNNFMRSSENNNT